MIVIDFHIISVIVVAPNKADTVLVIDPYAVPALPLALEGFKPVAGRKSEIVHYLGGIKHLELSASSPFYFTKTFHGFAVEEALAVLVSKGLDHNHSV
jgi:hypothetical protein